MISIDNGNAQIWNIYSESIKSDKKVSGKDAYNFYESIVDEIRPRVKEGIKTVLIASENRSDYEDFLEHVKKHQNWLIKGYELNRVSFEHVPHPARNVNEVKELINKTKFHQSLQEASTEDVQQVMKIVEKRINSPKDIENILFTLKEIEETVYTDYGKRPEYILMTDTYKGNHRRRVNRLLQVAKNKKIKINIVDNKTVSGKRLTQFGGLICLLTK
jgi:stalled ribosome rescue protein Dom34